MSEMRRDHHISIFIVFSHVKQLPRLNKSWKALLYILASTCRHTFGMLKTPSVRMHLVHFHIELVICVKCADLCCLALDSEYKTRPLRNFKLHICSK